MEPCSFSDHSKSAVIVSVMRSTVRVIGCAETASSRWGSCCASALMECACRWFEIRSPTSEAESSRSVSTRARFSSSFW